jgi:hypothetical protein
MVFRSFIKARGFGCFAQILLGFIHFLVDSVDQMLKKTFQNEWANSLARMLPGQNEYFFLFVCNLFYDSIISDFIVRLIVQDLLKLGFGVLIAEFLFFLLAFES